jgi:hypothetical protein
MEDSDPSKAEAFCARFFNGHPPEVPEAFPDDPSPFPMLRWTNTSLFMYVNDGNLFACGTNFDEVTKCLRHVYLDCWNWFDRAGLAIEPDTTEVVFFTNSHAAHRRPTRI